ncbi:MAG: nucleotidyltransferase family protein [Cyclonatronaceae bacterium]
MIVSELLTSELKHACEAFEVQKLYVFGSVVSDRFSDESDLDFLVEFNRNGIEGAFDQFIGLKQQLERIYERPVDLITCQSFRNPLFREEVEKNKVLIYAA